MTLESLLTYLRALPHEKRQAQVVYMTHDDTQLPIDTVSVSTINGRTTVKLSTGPGYVADAEL